MNFKGFVNDPGGADNGNGGGRPPPGGFPLARQSSVYSLTFDEFMTSMGGSGRDFGSMNMDELLKNIWSAEEVQSIGGGVGGGGEEGGGGAAVGHLQRQGSLTLPRTLSHKTVDQVWKDISKDYGPSLVAPPRQPTLGEMTLEEFLVRAGVVREDAKNDAVFADLARAGNNSGLGFEFQAQQMNRIAGLMGGNNRIPGASDDPIVSLQNSTNLPLNANGFRSPNQQQQMQNSHQQNHQQQQHHQQQQIFPKQPALNYATQMPNQGIRGGIVGLSADQGMNGNLAQGGGIGGLVGLAPGPVQLASGSPANQMSSSDIMGKSNGDTSSVSPVPYVFNGGLRGRKTGAVEKVIERRQRRMIKNRESAARSRARKQAYTMELEQEVAKLKEENEELQKKQEEIMEMQKNQVQEMMNLQREVKRKCLRRTQTGPW